MKISNSHQKFADQLKDQTALEYPERFLGPNWKDVLNFWIYLDTLSRDDLKLVFGRGSVLKDRDIPRRLAREAARDTIGCKYATYAYRNYHRGYATWELIGSHRLESLKFLPLFINF